jgi:hypothetical protein
MDEALRKLYLGIGVDDKNAIAVLIGVRDASNLAERALLGVAKAAQAMSPAASVAVTANNRLAASYGSVAAAATRATAAMRQAGGQAALQSRQLMNEMVSRGFPVQGQSALFPPGFDTLARQGLEQRLAAGAPPWNPAAFMSGIRAPTGAGPYMPGYPPSAAALRGSRGNFGLGTSIFLATAAAGAGAYGFQQAANLQRGALVASFANGQSPGAIQRQALGLSGQFNMRLSDSVSLLRDVAQLGIGNAAQENEVARAGAQFNVIQPDVAASDASKTIYRLLLASSKSQADLEKNLSIASRYAGGIYAAANVSAADNKEVFAMVTELAPLAQMMNLSAQGNIALAASFSNLNATQQSTFRGALTRMAITGKIDANNPIGSLMDIASRLRALATDSEKIDFLRSLGFKNVRDIQTVNVLAASMDTFAKAYAAVGNELQGTGTFGDRVNQVLHTMSGEWDGLKASMDRAAASIVGGLAPSLHLTLGLLTGIADTIAKHPALGGILGAAGLAVAGRGAYGFLARRFGTPEAERLAELGLDGPRGALRRGRLANNLANVFPLLGQSRAESFAGTRLGMSIAEGAGLAASAGVGRMSGISLGLLKLIPGGEGLAVGAAERMAAGGLGGTALRLATGPVGWILTALSLGAPLFERISGAFTSMASKGGAIGALMNTLGLVFDILAAGGRILNTAFDWLLTGGKWLLNFITGGHYDDVVGGINTGLSYLRTGAQGIAAPGQSPAKAQATNVTNVYTDGSRTGFQSAIDEVSRRSARTTSSTYGGIPV